MLIRYDIPEKLDLSKFRKQAEFYIGKMRELDYEFITKDYKVTIGISTPDDSNTHNVSIRIFDVKRDFDGEVLNYIGIQPLKDTRFCESSIIKSLFDPKDLYVYEAAFNSNSALDTTNKLADIIKLIHKLHSLRAFL
jgi:hypothetical protein